MRHGNPSITYDPRAAEYRDNLRLQAITNRAIANALNKRGRKPKPSVIRDIATGIGFGVLMVGAFGAANLLVYGAASLSAMAGGL